VKVLGQAIQNKSCEAKNKQNKKQKLVVPFQNDRWNCIRPFPVVPLSAYLSFFSQKKSARTVPLLR
jgi:hypothetical protein